MRFILYVIVHVLIISTVYGSVQNVGIQSLESRIVNGQRAYIKDYPFFVSVENFCGGSIISAFWVLTAAHCLEAYRVYNPFYPLKIYYGSDKLKSSYMEYASAVFIHPRYKKVTELGLLVNDFGLIRMRNGFAFKRGARPILLATQDTPVNSVLTVIGRGNDETGHPNKYLMRASYVTLSKDQCIASIPQTLYHYIEPHIRGMTEEAARTTICAIRLEKTIGTCDGDSGSALIDNNKLVGIVSYGANNCKTSKLTFFSKVTSGFDWIIDITTFF